jgi:hypothetical protein
MARRPRRRSRRRWQRRALGDRKRKRAESARGRRSPRGGARRDDGFPGKPQLNSLEEVALPQGRRATLGKRGGRAP